MLERGESGEREMHELCWIVFGGEHAATLPLHPNNAIAQHNTENVFYEEQRNVQW